MADCTGFHKCHLYRMDIFSLLVLVQVLLGYLVQAVFVCVFEQERICLFSVNISRPTRVSSHCFVYQNE